MRSGGWVVRWWDGRRYQRRRLPDQETAKYFAYDLERDGWGKKITGRAITVRKGYERPSR